MRFVNNNTKSLAKSVNKKDHESGLFVTKICGVTYYFLAVFFKVARFSCLIFLATLALPVVL